MPANLMEYFNKEPGLGILSTSSSNGQVDSAIFGSPHMTDEKTVVVATAKNHSFANLLENPNAVYIRMEQFLDSPKTGKMKPGSSVMDWKRIRVYMRMKKYATSRKMLEVIQKQAIDLIGEEATKMLHAAVIFETYEVRPLVDFGRGVGNSI